MDTNIILIISILVSGIFIYFFIKDIFQFKSKNKLVTQSKSELILLGNKNISISKINQLSPISTKLLKNDNIKLNEVILETKNIIDHTIENPSLIIELEDFYIYNMTYGKKENEKIVDFLIICFNKLAECNIARYNHFIGKLFNDIINSQLSTIDQLFQNIKADGNTELKIVTVEYFISQQLLERRSDYFIRLLNEFDLQSDDYIYRCVADFFANQFRNNRQRALKLFDAIFPKIDILNISSKRNINFFNLLGKLSVKLFIDSNGNLEDLIFYFKFLANKYSFIKGIFDEKTINPINKKIRNSLYQILEYSGINQWDQAIGNIETNRNINNSFFISAQGEKTSLNQRDELFEYYEFLINIHNGEFEKLIFNESSEFFKRTINLINYNEYSVIGYIATLSVTAYLLSSKSLFVERLNEVIHILNEQNTRSAKFFLFILCDGLLKLNDYNDEQLKKLIKISTQVIIPLKFKQHADVNIFYFLDNVSLNINSNMDYYTEILDQVLTEELVTNNYEEIRMDAIQTCFLSNIQIGKFLSIYIINSKLVKLQNGKMLLIDILGALYYRDKDFVSEMIKLCETNKNLKISEWDIINNIETPHDKIRDARSYQTNWNQLLLRGIINDKRLRYYIIKDLIGGLTQSNSVEDFSKEFRRFIIEIAKGYLNDIEITNIDLTKEMAFNSTESKINEKVGVQHYPK